MSSTYLICITNQKKEVLPKMDAIHTTLKNYSFIENINQIIPDTKGFEYTKKGVIRAIKKPLCPDTGVECVRNGWDVVTRKNLLKFKIGKFKSPRTGKTIRSDTAFWDNLVHEWEETISSFFLRLADRDVAVRVISDIMEFIAPMSKDTVLRHVFSAIKKLVIPTFKGKYQIVHYDEQHPKKGRLQKYRLALICAVTGEIIADEYYDDKTSDVVEAFLRTHLDTKKQTVIITDDCPWYPEVFNKIWGNKVKHQLCLLHLDKLIVADCGKVKTLQEMYNTYLLLNIFFNREKELEFIQMLIEEERSIEIKNSDWLKKARKRFNTFVRNLEKMRRRNKENLELRPFEDAKANFSKLQGEALLLEKPLQKRLEYIAQHWKQFTLFYTIDDCPHTNNVIENYFSSSLKTHRKKQFRTDEGIKNKLKLSRYKKNVGFMEPIKSFLEWGRAFLILDSG